jgi:hypothetical protein
MLLVVGFEFASIVALLNKFELKYSTNPMPSTNAPGNMANNRSR